MCACECTTWGDIPAFNKVFKVVAPKNPVVRLILEFRDWLANNISQEVNQYRFGLHFCAVSRERETMLGNLEQRHTQRPDVRRDGIRLARDPLGRHIVRRADKRVGIALGPKFAADPEIAQFDLSVAAEQDIRWFDVLIPVS